MRIKDEIVCFAHLRWCHNGWASNILIVVDTGYAGIHHSKYWTPIHYDTIEDWQNKNLIFYSLTEGQPSDSKLSKSGFHNNISPNVTLHKTPLMSPYMKAII